MILNTHYAYGAGVSAAVIVVTAPTASTVTATLDGTVYNAQEVNGTWTFKVRKFGTYTVSATLGNQTASTTVAVTEKKTYEVALSYTFKLVFTTNSTTYDSTKGAVEINGKLYYQNTTLELQPGTTVKAIAYYSPDINPNSGLYINGTQINTFTGRQEKNININSNMTVKVTNYSSGRYGASRTEVVY